MISLLMILRCVGGLQNEGTRNKSWKRIVTIVEVNEHDRSRRRVHYWENIDVTSVRRFFETRIFLNKHFKLCVVI